jgi:antitoxin ParD1/3/4
MAKNTSILLGDHFEKFISNQVDSGKYGSASEVVRAALRLFEHEELMKEELVNALIKGENSGFIKNFNREAFLKNLRKNGQIGNDL